MTHDYEDIDGLDYCKRCGLWNGCDVPCSPRVAFGDSPSAIDTAITAFANRIADELERRIQNRHGASAAALAEAAQVIREAGKR